MSLRFQKSVESRRRRRLLVSCQMSSLGSRPHCFSGPSTLDTIGAPVTRTATPAPPPQTAEETQSAFIQQLAHVPELAPYGTVINSSKSVQLTENETEYQVSCVKHVFREHIVFQVGAAVLSQYALVLNVYILSLMCQIRCRIPF